MRTLVLVAAGLLWGSAGFAQTAPATSTSPTPASGASGTKNVGTDRADAPQAPGMTPNGSRPPARRPARKPTQPRPARQSGAAPASPR